MTNISPAHFRTPPRACSKRVCRRAAFAAGFRVRAFGAPRNDGEGFAIMFDIGWSELVVIAIVALIAIGPKELPNVLRMVGTVHGQDPPHGVGIPGPVPGGDARGRDGRPEEAGRRHDRRCDQGLHRLRPARRRPQGGRKHHRSARHADQRAVGSKRFARGRGTGHAGAGFARRHHPAAIGRPGDRAGGAATQRRREHEAEPEAAKSGSGA